MKYLITESQSEKIANKIKESLEKEFSNESICGFNVYVNDDEDYTFSGIKYDIHIVFKLSYLVRFNSTGINNLRIVMTNKVKNFMNSFIPVEFGVTTLSKDC